VEELTQEYLKNHLDYDTKTGIFTWTCSQRLKGKVAGTLHHLGYIHIIINSKIYMAHRLAWFYVYGDWPKYEIDHINGIKTDNKIENLRDVTKRENQLNRKCHRNGVLQGASCDKRTKRWQAKIRIDGKKTHIGMFDTQQEAHLAFMKALKTQIEKQNT
jgi:hypothetical protein